MIQRICFNRIACVWCMALMGRLCAYWNFVLRSCCCFCLHYFFLSSFCYLSSEMWVHCRKRKSARIGEYFPRLHTFGCKCARHKTQKNGQLDPKSVEMNWWKWPSADFNAHKIFANYIDTHTLFHWGHSSVWPFNRNHTIGAKNPCMTLFNRLQNVAHKSHWSNAVFFPKCHISKCVDGPQSRTISFALIWLEMCANSQQIKIIGTM